MTMPNPAESPSVPRAVDAAGTTRAITLLNTPLQVTSYEHWVAACQRLAAGPSVVAVEFANTHTVTMRRHDAAFREMTDCVDFFVPDGMPLVWCLNRKGAGMRDRVYGPTFMKVCLQTLPATFSHYFLGGSEDVGRGLRARLRDWNPAARVAGSFHGFCHPDGRLEGGADDAVIEEINRLSPDFIWLGLGTPKQQAWLSRNKKRIRRGVICGVGFAFDVNAGTKKDAPAWMQRGGLTWLYRLCSEPRRLAGRYLKFNTLFLYYLVRDCLRQKAKG